ncbi:lysophospholipid acyltransferase family protein [Acidobacteriota bacterium]
MSFWRNVRWWIVGVVGKVGFWLWAKSCRWTILGEEKYKDLRLKGKAVVHLIWHGKIFIVPYFFRNRDIMPLISPSEDGEIPARIMSGWGYKILRGSGSHAVIRVWNEMKKELDNGGEVMIIPDGPKGPNRVFKMGGIKLAYQTGAYLVPFSFSTSQKINLKSWDSFLISKPFSKVVAIFGDPISIDPQLEVGALEEVRQKLEKSLRELDDQADHYFD